METMMKFMYLTLVLYPVIGAFCWVIGTFCYKFFYKHEIQEFKKIPTQDEPFVTIMIPAHNEEVMIEDTITYLMTKMDYLNYEVLVMDDGSTDSTPTILENLSLTYDNLRVVRIEANKGKAHAFNIGVAFAKGEFILSNDADTVPEPSALWKYMNYFNKEEGKNYAAVTANMDVQNRSNLLEKSQTVEFSSIVGAIKRGQMGTLGGMYAYSGANTMYRKDALIDVGLFRQDRATEDISICWDHQFNGWKSVFAPDIMFYMNVPSSLKMLYLQRKRWAKGGTEAWLTNFAKVLRHPISSIDKVVLLLDQTLSIIWSLFYIFSSVVFVLAITQYFIAGNMERVVFMIDLAFIFICSQMIAGFTQLLVSLLLDNKGKKMKYLFFSPIYMLIYWRINAITIAMTLIPAIKTILGFGQGVWISPERIKLNHHDKNL